MDEHITFQFLCLAVINTACTVNNIGENDKFHLKKKFLQQIYNRNGKDKEAIGKLQGDPCGARFANSPNGLVNFKVVVVRQTRSYPSI